MVFFRIYAKTGLITFIYPGMAVGISSLRLSHAHRYGNYHISMESTTYVFVSMSMAMHYSLEEYNQ